MFLQIAADLLLTLGMRQAEHAWLDNTLAMQLLDLCGTQIEQF